MKRIGKTYYEGSFLVTVDVVGLYASMPALKNKLEEQTSIAVPPIQII